MANNLSLGIVIGATVSGSVARAFQTLDQRATHLGRTLQQVRAQRVAGTAAGEDISHLIRQEERLAGSLQRTNTLRDNRSRRRELVGDAMGTIGLAMMAAAPIKAAAAFETVMVDLRESVTATDTEFKTMGTDILHLSTVLPLATSAFGEIYAQGGKLGIVNKDLKGFALDVGAMSIALGISGEAAGEMMAHWRNSMGLSQQKAVLLGDAVNALGDAMNINTTDLGEVIRKEGEYAKTAGFTEIQTAALSAALLNSGTPAKQAGMIFKGITGALLSGEKATKAQAAAFEELGMTSTEVTAKMKADAVGTFQEVLAAVAKQPKELQGGIIGNLFGPKAKEPILALIANSESLSKALNIVGKESNYAGANQEEAGKKSQTTANQLIMAANSTNELGVVIGQALLPTLKTMVAGFSSVAGWISEFSAQLPGTQKAVVLLGTALIGLKVVWLVGAFIKTFVSDIWTMGKGLYAFATSAKIVTAAQWLFNASLFGCPIVWIIGGLVALGALAYVVYKNWEPIKELFKTIWADLVTGVQAAGTAISGAFSAMASTVQGIWGGFTSWFSGTFPAMAAAASSIGATISGAFSAMAATVRGIWESLIAWLSEKFAQIGRMANNLITTAQTIGSTVSSIGKWATTPVIGKGAAVGAAMAATVAMPAHATPLPPMSTGKQPQSVMYNNTNATIHVTQKAGEDSNAFADRVIKKLKNQEAADKRGRLHD